MLHAHHIRIVLPLALAAVCFGAIGCSGEDPERSTLADESARSYPSLDTSDFIRVGGGVEGTWEGSDLVGMISKITLMTDGRYHVFRNVGCRGEGCDPIVEQDGRYEIVGRSSNRVLELKPTNERVAEPFELRVEDRSLSLRPLRSANGWLTLTHTSSAWCGVARDCSVQSLPPGICAGRYECATNVCTWKCAGLRAP